MSCWHVPISVNLLYLLNRHHPPLHIGHSPVQCEHGATTVSSQTHAQWHAPEHWQPIEIREHAIPEYENGNRVERSREIEATNRRCGASNTIKLGRDRTRRARRRDRKERSKWKAEREKRNKNENENAADKDTRKAKQSWAAVVELQHATLVA